jgi:hypothetical protein
MNWYKQQQRMMDEMSAEAAAIARKQSRDFDARLDRAKRERPSVLNRQVREEKRQREAQS